MALPDGKVRVAALGMTPVGNSPLSKITGLWKRYRLKRVASINETLLPGPWQIRNGRRALPLPVDLPLFPPRGAVLRSWVDRGYGWKPLRLEGVPPRLEGPGWWGDPELCVRVPPESLLAKAWRKWRLGAWRRQANRPVPTLPRPALKSRPLVSILIPTNGKTVVGLRGPVDLVANCYRSIVAKTSYPNYEILIAHDGRIAPGIPALPYAPGRPFNLAHKWNWMIDRARGEYIILLNDDTEVIEPDWIQALLEYATQPDVGVVGCKLLFPDGRIQHAGVVFGVGTLCGHVFMGHPEDCPGTQRPREFSAVTAACLMTRRGERLDESFKGIFDIDLCLRARRKGLKVVYTPYAKLFHLESATFRLSGPGYFHELMRFRRKWPNCLPDPFYTEDLPECDHPPDPSV